VGSGRLESLSSLCLLFGARPSDWFGEQGHKRASDVVADFDDQTRRYRASSAAYNRLRDYRVR
jgi:hypothetical protein